jgi:hypothetical protein
MNDFAGSLLTGRPGTQRLFISEIPPATRLTVVLAACAAAVRVMKLPLLGYDVLIP